MATIMNKGNVDTADILNALLGSKFALAPYEAPAKMGIGSCVPTKREPSVPVVKNLIYNPPATIVTWTDGTKTVIKCDGNDKFSKEFGLAMAYMKKIFGARNGFKRIIDTAYCPQEKKAAEEAKKLENKKRLEEAELFFDYAVNAHCADSCDCCCVTYYKTPNAFQK